MRLEPTVFWPSELSISPGRGNQRFSELQIYTSFLPPVLLRFLFLMEELLREVNQGFQKRRENESLAWSLMRSAFERHANTLESLAMAITQTTPPQQEDDQITQTELLKHSRQFYNHDTICVALFFLNAQYQHNVTEAITGTLIQDTLQLIELLDPESIKFGGPEGNFLSLLH